MKSRQRADASRRQGLIGFAITFVAGMIVWLPGFGSRDRLSTLDKLSFDLICAFHSSQPITSVEIIQMDDKSYSMLSQDSVWDRSLHARLLKKLTADRAKVVIFDALFSPPRVATSDQELAQAMRAHGNVVLAADANEIERGPVKGMEPTFPEDLFRSAAAGVGHWGLSKGTDGVIRQHPNNYDGLPSLPWTAAKTAGASAISQANPEEVRWLNYYGPPAAVLPRLSYADALGQAAGFFEDRIVFVGDARRIKSPGDQADSYRTPHTRWDGQETFGVDLLALCFLNLVNGDSLTRFPPLAELGFMLAVGFIAGFGLIHFGPIGSTGLALLLAVGVTVMAVMLHAREHIWFSWLILAGVQVPCAWVCSLAVYVRNRRTASAAAAAPEAPPTSVPVTARIPDHELLRMIGKGAYGEVWLARNAVGLYHAVKIIQRKEFEDDKPYEREIRGITSFMPISRSHPGFVNILHVGRNDEAGYFYCIMEAADDEKLGQDIRPDTYSPKNLTKHLQAQKRLPPDECLQLGLRLADALDHLHNAQLIHRDIKPSNIIFVNGTPKLADIGLVTSISDKPGEISYLGTMGYIAPEGPGAPLADIYSLGKVLYEAFTGLDRDQFPNLPSTLLDATGGRFSKLNLIILNACEADPKNRYQSAAELRTALEALDNKREARSQ